MGFFAIPAHPVTQRNRMARRSRMQQRGLRSYSPTLRRWIRRDPIGEESSANLMLPHLNRVRMNPSLSHVSLVQNSPVCKIDVLGAYPLSSVSALEN
jgi:RHS repeat-associated protein